VVDRDTDMTATWTCSICGVVHDGVPLDWGFDAPAYWNEERDADGGHLDSDLCAISRGDGDFDRFARGLIEIPILDGTAPDEKYFGIGAWVSLSAPNFNWYAEHFEADADEQGGPWFGWLSNSIPVYPETLSLKTNVHLRGEGWRPLIEIQPSEHPLSVDQRNGIPLARAHELAAQWTHA
jgi:hypothetical protein